MSFSAVTAVSTENVVFGLWLHVISDVDMNIWESTLPTFLWSEWLGENVAKLFGDYSKVVGKVEERLC